jgi:hypothetical protein
MKRQVWTAEEVERLRLHIEKGGSVSRAIAIFKRPEDALRRKAQEHGWKFPTIRQLRNRASGTPSDLSA